MAKEWAKPFYNSKGWKKCREGYIRSVQGLCESCLSKGRVRPGKICHHTIWLTPENITDANVSLNWQYLSYDCQDCHTREHQTVNAAMADGLMFDSEGNVVRSGMV